MARQVDANFFTYWPRAGRCSVCGKLILEFGRIHSECTKSLLIQADGLIGGLRRWRLMDNLGMFQRDGYIIQAGEYTWN